MLFNYKSQSWRKESAFLKEFSHWKLSDRQKTYLFISLKLHKKGYGMDRNRMVMSDYQKKIVVEEFRHAHNSMSALKKKIRSLEAELFFNKEKLLLESEDFRIKQERFPEEYEKAMRLIENFDLCRDF